MVRVILESLTSPYSSPWGWLVSAFPLGGKEKPILQSSAKPSLGAHTRAETPVQASQTPCHTLKQCPTLLFYE